MKKSNILLITLILLLACTKKQLKETTLTLNDPIEQQVYHKGDTVFIFGEISYEKKIKDIGYFIAITDTLGIDSTFYQRTVLPLQNPHSIKEYYINEFNQSDNIVLSYGKRNVKSGQIYEIKELNLKFVP
ncbi:MAG: hypothetical protein ACK5B9_14240 [Flavobacteriia bacterium]|jgi:hypothetical protein